MICQAIVLVSSSLVEVIVKDPVATAVTQGVPWAFPQSLIQLTNAGPGGTPGTPCVTAVPDRGEITRLS